MPSVSIAFWTYAELMHNASLTYAELVNSVFERTSTIRIAYKLGISYMYATGTLGISSHTLHVSFSYVDIRRIRKL